MTNAAMAEAAGTWLRPIRFLLLAVAVAASLSTPLAAGVVEDWIRIADRGPDGKPLPPPQRAQPEQTAPPLVALAMFEAADMIDHRYESYLGLSPAHPEASQQVAVAAAAHHVLVGIYPDRKGELDAALELSLAAVPASPAREAGLQVGRLAGAAALKREMFDGPAVEAYRPAGDAGRFVPPVLPAVAPCLMRVHPFFLKSWDEVMPPPPPATSSQRYARDLEETRLSGGKNRANATPASLRMAQFMAQFTPDPTVERIAASRARIVDQARLWALMRMAAHDANGAIVQAKMRYMSWRPLNAIRNADRDDNPATTRDPDWEPVMPTPNHPEYPCGHCGFSGLAAGVLRPDSDGPVTVASYAGTLPMTLTYPDWDSFLAAASLARIQGGMHFRFSNEAGQAMGMKIGQLARQRAMRPLPARR